MPTWTPENAECLVYTYKEGLLSRAAHDLKIRVTRFRVVLEDDALEAVFEANSLRTEVAMKRGQENPAALSPADKSTIDSRIQEAVLHSRSHPRIRFHAERVSPSSPTWTVPGTLSLHGVERALRVPVRTEGQHWITRLQLHQPDYGIEPFRALLGALKIKPHVEVVLRCRLPE